MGYGMRCVELNDFIPGRVYNKTRCKLKYQMLSQYLEDVKHEAWTAGFRGCGGVRY